MNGRENHQLLTWRRIWLILIVLAAIWILLAARAALTPLLVAFILAYVLNPLVEVMERRRIPRMAAIILLMVGLGVLLILLWLSLAPLVEKQVAAFTHRLPAYVKVVEGWFNYLIKRLNLAPPEEIQKFISDNISMLARMPLEALSAGGKLLFRTTKGILSLITGLAYLVLIPLMTFYLLLDLDRITQNFYLVIPDDYREEVRRRMERIDEVLGSFIKGQLTVGLILAVLYALGFYFVDMPLWLIVGVFAGLVSIFPYVEWIVALPVTLVLAAIQHQDWLHPIAVLMIFGVISPMAGMFLIPRVVGGRVGLHPVVVIVAILMGGELLGFVGILLAVPLAAIIKVGLETFYDFYIA